MNWKNISFGMSMLLLWSAFVWSACGNNNTAKTENEMADSLPPDETVHDGIVQLQPSHVNDTVTWNGKVYRYDIVRKADISLPSVHDEVSGDTFYDNTIVLNITLDGKEFFSKKFSKTSFDKYLNADFKKNAILEGLVFDVVTPAGLRFATSVCYPRSDLYMPLAITIDKAGNMVVTKDELPDIANIVDE
ncbi:MAG TPA: DUF4738 domain-containing protein [Prevotellaceae bacterium]|nr:DUF4738 domain-containing protein [Prevotellaceae bacterium]